MEHLRAILKCLRLEKLYANLKECTFCSDLTVFLAFIMSEERLKLDETKIQTIKEYPQPTTPTQIRYFLGLAGIYSCFVRDFWKLFFAFSHLKKKDLPYPLMRMTFMVWFPLAFGD